MDLVKLMGNTQEAQRLSRGPIIHRPRVRISPCVPNERNAMKYTKNIPTVPGFYWTIDDLESRMPESIVEVYENMQDELEYELDNECHVVGEEDFEMWAGPLNGPSKENLKFK